MKNRKPLSKAQRVAACAAQRERDARIREEMSALPFHNEREIERKLGLLRFAIRQLEDARAAVLNARNAEEQLELSQCLGAFEREVERRRVDLGMPKLPQEGVRR